MRYNELIENLTDTSDEELFGEPVRRLASPEQAIIKFKIHYSAIRRVPDRDGKVQDSLERMFNLKLDRRFSASENLGHAGWSVNAYTTLAEPVAVLSYWDSGGGDWAYIGARSKQDLEKVLQMLYDIGAVENPEAKKARIAATRQRKIDAATKKGIRVGAKIRLKYFNPEVIGTVVDISPTGKITIEYDHPNIGNPAHNPFRQTTTAHAIKKADVVGESEESDDELFGNIKDLRFVDFKSIELDGVDRRDYPDFADAYVDYAEWKDGQALTDDELEWLTSELQDSGELNSMAHDSLYEDDESDDELFGNPVHKIVGQWLANFANTMRNNPAEISGLGPEDGQEYENDLEEIREEAKAVRVVAAAFDRKGIVPGLQAWLDYHGEWWENFEGQMEQDTGISLSDLFDQYGDQLTENSKLTETTAQSQILNLIVDKIVQAMYRSHYVNSFKEFVVQELKKGMPFVSQRRPNYGIHKEAGIPLKSLGIPVTNDPAIDNFVNSVIIRFNNDPEETPGPGGTYGYYVHSNQDLLQALKGNDYPGAIVINLKEIATAAKHKGMSVEQEVKSTLIHEITHGIDDLKSHGKALRRKQSTVDPSSKEGHEEYLKRSHEINARFSQALLDIANGMKAGQTDLQTLINTAFEKHQLRVATGKAYNRLLSRAYAFFQAQQNNPKALKPTGTWLERAIAWIKGNPTATVAENSEPSDDELFGEAPYKPMSQALDWMNSHDLEELGLEHGFQYGESENDAGILDAYLEDSLIGYDTEVVGVRFNDEDPDDPLVKVRPRREINENDDVSDDELFGRTRMWYANIMGNYNTGRYSDYGARKYIVPGTSPEDAMRWLERNEEWVHMYMDSQKFPSGKRVVRRPARSNIFIDKSSISGEAPEGSNSAIENFMRKNRAL